MEPNTEHHAIPMSQSEVSFKPQKRSRFRSFSLSHLSVPKALVNSVAPLCVQFLVMFIITNNRLAYGNAVRACFPAQLTPGMNAGPARMELLTSVRGQLLDIFKELDNNFSYRCWNSQNAGDIDLCKICRDLLQDLNVMVHRSYSGSCW